MIQITLTEDNYHPRHRYITIHEVEPHTDHNHETIIITTQILEIIGTIKDIGNQIITITEVQVIIETITVETEETATIEITIITDTIVDQVQDIQIEKTLDNNHHTTEIIITITITDKDITAEIQTETTDLDNVQVVTIEITQTTITKTTGEIRHIENKIKEITLQNDEMKEINITIIIIKRTE